MAADWVGDSVMGFLASPLYTVPITTFMENNCIVFDTEEEHKIEYTLIHNKFKELVEALLEGFLSDLDIEPSSFGNVMRTDFGVESDIISADHLRWATQTVAAAGDYLLFRNLMTERNLELEAEVLQMVGSVGSTTDGGDHSLPTETPEWTPAPSGVTGAAPDGENPTGLSLEEEEEILQHAMKLSSASYEKEVRERDWDADEMQRAIELSRLEYEALQKRLHDQHLATQRQLELSLKETAAAAPKLKKAPKSKASAEKKDPFARKGTKAEHVKHQTSDSPDTTLLNGAGAVPGAAKSTATLDRNKKEKLGELRELPKLRLQRSVEAASAAQWVCEPIPMGAAAAPAPNATATPASSDASRRPSTDAVKAAFFAGQAAGAAVASADAEADTPTDPEIERRRQYFLEQRDKLRANKQEERERSLQAFTDNAGGDIARLGRPANEPPAPSKRRGSSTSKKGSDDRPAGELFRQALATRLTQEVVRGGNIRSERGAHNRP